MQAWAGDGFAGVIRGDVGLIGRHHDLLFRLFNISFAGPQRLGRLSFILTHIIERIEYVSNNSF